MRGAHGHLIAMTTTRRSASSLRVAAFLLLAFACCLLRVTNAQVNQPTPSQSDSSSGGARSHAAGEDGDRLAVRTVLNALLQLDGVGAWDAIGDAFGSVTIRGVSLLDLFRPESMHRMYESISLLNFPLHRLVDLLMHQGRAFPDLTRKESLAFLRDFLVGAAQGLPLPDRVTRALDRAFSQDGGKWSFDGSTDLPLLLRVAEEELLSLSNRARARGGGIHGGGGGGGVERERERERGDLLPEGGEGGAAGVPAACACTLVIGRIDVGPAAEHDRAGQHLLAATANGEDALFLDILPGFNRTWGILSPPKEMRGVGKGDGKGDGKGRSDESVPRGMSAGEGEGKAVGGARGSVVARTLGALAADALVLIGRGGARSAFDVRPWSDVCVRVRASDLCVASFLATT